MQCSGAGTHSTLPRSYSFSHVAEFSDRYGFKPAEPEITIREDAPDDLRFAIAQIAVNAGMGPTRIRDVVCTVLFVAPDRNNWSEYPNIWDEVRGLLEDCEWFKVYDIAERLHRSLHYQQADQFRDELNGFFREKGIGWELKDNEGIVFRGSAPFTAATINAVEALTATGRTNAAPKSARLCATFPAGQSLTGQALSSIPLRRWKALHATSPTNRD
ncbi:hypothetical protein BQ8794_240007 [Mesorhizobium prunaredense]|uniref:HEPN AbiJ-N-terminal domain-containing protein n=2 Tax=Mesorhizobium TaxID=68287 RepID=A0A1R3V953_9HYPH|nr:MULTISPECIES: hypothetical protein [Mesorhizobium]CAH2394094.1 conserved hypothetical protein [Mesorhizobium ventifaucium]SIT55800.1 hypothetical protein BQ8794_240007 [Mesorhizobium prunaredense]